MVGGGRDSESSAGVFYFCTSRFQQHSPYGKDLKKNSLSLQLGVIAVRVEEEERVLKSEPPLQPLLTSGPLVSRLNNCTPPLWKLSCSNPPRRVLMGGTGGGGVERGERKAREDGGEGKKIVSRIITACQWQLWFLCDFLFLPGALRGVAAGRGLDVRVVERVSVCVCVCAHVCVCVTPKVIWNRLRDACKYEGPQAAASHSCVEMKVFTL